MPGKWESAEFNYASPGLELRADGEDGLVFSYPGFMEYAAKFDGKPYPIAGRAISSKWTMAFRKTGSASFEITRFTDGKPSSVATFTVSADGKILTHEMTKPSRNDPTKAVSAGKFIFERQ